MRTKEEYLDEIRDNLIEIEVHIEIINSYIVDIRRIAEGVRKIQ